jgi:poly-gamma-glutamate synthase PgsB/CapB
MIIFYFISFIIFLLYLIIEYNSLQYAIKTIPNRILVNGTRGKSTTVKLIFRILQKNGMNVYAKVTGDNPTLILPDGTNKIFKRYSPTSIKENIKLLKQISKKKPDAIIMECMALASETQSMLAKLIFKPHYVIIVNVLPDHKEIMGETIEKNQLTILECVYKKSTVLLTTTTNRVLKNVEFSHNKINIAQLTKFNSNFENIPHKIITESWSIIEEISKLLNIDEEIAKNEFISEWKLINEKIKMRIPGSNIDIWNLFSINDVATTESFVQLSQNLKKENKTIFIINSRLDRPIRTKEFVEYIANNFLHSNVWLMGSGKQLAKNILMKNHFPKESVLYLRNNQIIDKIKKSLPNNTSLYCIGNHKGAEHLLYQLKDLSLNNGE